MASTTGAGATTKLRPADQKAIFGLVANALAITTSFSSARRSLPWPVTSHITRLCPLGKRGCPVPFHALCPALIMSQCSYIYREPLPQAA